MSANGRTVIRFVIWGFLYLITGCGNDSTVLTSTSGTISGIATAGAPLIGTVTIKDSNSTGIEKQVPIAADGTYRIELYGLTPPFALRADGLVGSKFCQLYAVATSADINGSINITPLTDLIVANIAGQSAKNYYDNSGYTSLTASEVNSAHNALLAILQPILTAIDLPGTIDLLRTPFKVDHTGMDAVLDLIKVTIDKGIATATLENIVTHETVINNFATQTYSNAFTNTTDMRQAVTDIRAIVAQLKQYSSLFATGLPSSTDPRLLALFDSESFLDKGRVLNVFLSAITTSEHRIGLTTDVIIDSIDPIAGTASVQPIPIRKGGYLDQDNAKRYIKKNGIWLDQGDGWLAFAYLCSEGVYYPNSSPALDPVFQVGLSMTVQADQPGNANVFYAVITGPGLPDTGVFLDFTDFGYNLFYAFKNDVKISLIPDNAVYTIDFYDYAFNLLATFTQKLPKRPPKFAELSAAAFPVPTMQTLSDLFRFTGGDLGVAWTLPENLYTDSLLLRLSDSASGNKSSVTKGLDGNLTSITLSLQPVTNTSVTFTPDTGWLIINAKDVYGRWFDTYVWSLPSVGTQQAHLKLLDSDTIHQSQSKGWLP